MNTFEIDLSGRCLIKDGESFHLHMARHPPVKDPYPSVFAEEHTSVQDLPLSSSWRITTDGSSTKGRGGYAIIIQPPAMSLSRSWIRRQGIDGRCTNIRAEITAVIEACKVIRQVLLRNL